MPSPYEEPVITINGHALTSPEAATVRIAIESFSSQLMETGLSTDDHGIQMVSLYMRSIEKLRTKMYTP